MMLGKLANRIGRRGIAGQGEGLASATAEVTLAEFAAAAGFLHPLDPATCSGVGISAARFWSAQP